MQQAYQALRIVAEAQTIRMVLTSHPDELMLRELCTACAALNTESSNGVKAVVLDFTVGTQTSTANVTDADPSISSTTLESVRVVIHAVAQPVLAVIRASVSVAASTLIHAADLTLVAQHALLNIFDGQIGANNERLTGAQAVRLGYVTWSAPAHEIDKEMERVLDLLRAKSAAALRYTKASVRLVQQDSTKPTMTHQEALRQVNTLYLTQVMRTDDAHEGLHAFLEKRQPEWNNQ